MTRLKTSLVPSKLSAKPFPEHFSQILNPGSGGWRRAASPIFQVGRPPLVVTRPRSHGERLRKEGHLSDPSVFVPPTPERRKGLWGGGSPWPHSCSSLYRSFVSQDVSASRYVSSSYLSLTVKYRFPLPVSSPTRPRGPRRQSLALFHPVSLSRPRVVL